VLRYYVDRAKLLWNELSLLIQITDLIIHFTDLDIFDGIYNQN